MIKAEWTNKDSLDLQPTCNQLATTEGDFINRVDAIECIRWGKSVTDVIDRINALPSAEPKTGKWVDCGMNADGTHNIKCDQCGAGFRTRGHANSHYTKERFKWCPTCGARMKGEDDEHTV